MISQLSTQLKAAMDMQEQDRFTYRETLSTIGRQNEELRQEVNTLKLQNGLQDAVPQAQESIMRLFRMDHKLVPNFSADLDLNPDTYSLEDFKFDCSEYIVMFPDLPEPTKLAFATQRLKGRAHSWYKNQITIQKKKFRSLADLFHSLGLWYNVALPPNDDRNQLFNLQQTGSVMDFTDAFNQILLRLEITSDEACDRYIRKLKPQVQARVQSTSLIWDDLSLLQQEALKQETINSTRRSNRNEKPNPNRSTGGTPNFGTQFPGPAGISISKQAFTRSSNSAMEVDITTLLPISLEFCGE
jgi:hypothetical protein